jgi:hypothetical protein
MIDTTTQGAASGSELSNRSARSSRLPTICDGRPTLVATAPDRLVCAHRHLISPSDGPRYPPRYCSSPPPAPLPTRPLSVLASLTLCARADRRVVVWRLALPNAPADLSISAAAHRARSRSPSRGAISTWASRSGARRSSVLGGQLLRRARVAEWSSASRIDAGGAARFSPLASRTSARPGCGSHPIW